MNKAKAAAPQGAAAKLFVATRSGRTVFQNSLADTRAIPHLL
jgi:hypothetical protein